MSGAKFRVAQSLKVFGLHPESEVRELREDLERDRFSLEERTEELNQVRTRLNARNEKLQERNEQLQERNEQLRERNEQLQERNKQLQTDRQRKFQGPEDEPIWHRRVIGGRWDEIGQLQLDFLRERGLRPEHYFLDVGCGSLRGGVRFIPYLEKGRYYGVDRNEQLLAGGRKEIEAANLWDRLPNLSQMDDFGFDRLDQVFDFALANSVFTHMPLNSIVRCLVNVDRVLRPGGGFYATFFENPEGRTFLEPLEQGDGFSSFYDQDPFHYTRDALEWACEETGLTASYVGDWGHPRHQVMMEFRKRDGIAEG